MSEAPGAASGVQLCEELLDLATTDLYRNNLFRVLAIPVNAGPADVRQRQKRLEMQRKLGLSTETVSAGPFPLTPPPAAEAAAKAIERLNDPVARFLDEFFWFSAPAAGDAGLAALEAGNLVQARVLWKRQAAGAASDGHGPHNLAVMEHLLALERTDQGASASAALAAWRAALADDAFWNHVRSRVEALNDARLTTGFVRRLRDSLPRMLLLIFARQAVGAFEQGEAASATALLKVIRGSRYGAGNADDAIHEALKPLRSRISAAVAAAKGRWAKTPQHGDRIVRELYQSVQPLLAIHDGVADGDLARQGVHDEVGEAMNLAEIAYCKATNNWVEGEKLLVLAQQVAMGQRLRDQIAENIRIDQENAKSGNDWCAPGYWALQPAEVAELERARAQAEAGNYDAALEILLVMDKRIGPPVTRAAAYSMSVKGIRKFNQALGEYQSVRPMVKKIMDKLPDTWRLPNPELPSYMMPPCLACGLSSYSSWVKFTHSGNNLFMCSSCSEKDDRNIAERKQILVAALQEPMEYLALAARLDPQDPGIRRNREGIEKDAREFGFTGTVDANALAHKLTVSRVRRVAVPAVGSATDTCFYCGQRAGVAAASIRVPVHGPETRVEFLLGRGVEYQHGEVVVPRCAQCRQHHQEWPERIEAWHEDALWAGDEDRFPALVDALDQSVREAAAAHEHIATCQDDQSFPLEAGAVATAVEALELRKLWVANSMRAVTQAEAVVKRTTTAAGLLDRLVRRPNPARDAALTFLEATKTQGTLARNLEQQAITAHMGAQNALLQAKADAKRVATARFEACRQTIQSRTEALQLARELAVAAHVAANPQPVLPAGIRQECDLMEAPGVVAATDKSWTFGDRTAEEGGPEAKPTGTVSRSPVLREMVPTTRSPSANRRSPSPSASSRPAARTGPGTSSDGKTCPKCNLPLFDYKGTPTCYTCGYTPTTASPPPLPGAATPASRTEGGSRTGKCPRGHGPLRPWEGTLRCWTCGYPDK